MNPDADLTYYGSETQYRAALRALGLPDYVEKFYDKHKELTAAGRPTVLMYPRRTRLQQILDDVPQE